MTSSPKAILSASLAILLISPVVCASSVTDKPVYSEELCSPNEKWALSSLPSINGAKSALLVWNARTKTLAKKISFSWSYVTPLAFSSSGRWLAISGTIVPTENGQTLHTYLQIWDTNSWRMRRVLEKSRRAWADIAWIGRFSDDEKTFTTVNYNRIEKWSLRTGRRFKAIPLEFAATDEGGMEAKISPSGKLLVLASGGSLALMKMRNGKVLHRFHRHTENEFMVFSPNENMIADVDSDGVFRVWSTQNGKTLWMLSGNIGLAKWSSDSRRILFTNGSRVVTRDGKTGKEIR